MKKQSKIFLSYCWANREVADQIYQDLSKVGLKLSRDVHDLPAFGNIKEFMKKIRQHDYALLLVSDAFLKSTNCMYEVLELMKEEAFEKRILHIVFPDVKIYDPKDKADYIKYWEDKTRETEKLIDSIARHNRGDLEEELQHCQNIAHDMHRFLKPLSGKLSVSLEELKAQNYGPMLQHIGHEQAELYVELLAILKMEDEEELDNALDDFRENHSGWAPFYFAKGNVEYNRKQYKKALHSYLKAIGLNLEFAEAYYNRGVVYNELGETKKAIDDYSNAIKFNPELAEAYYNRGGVYKKLGETKKAIDDYFKAIKFNPEHAKAYVNRGGIYKELGKTKKAIEDFSKAIELNSKHAQAYYNRGITYDELDKIPEAIADYSKAIVLNPKLTEAYHNRGLAYSKSENYPQAINDFSKAIELNPNFTDAYNNRGFAYTALGENQQAINDFSKAIEINPNFPEIYYNRGLIFYSKMNDSQAACRDWQKAADLGLERAKKLLQEIGY